MRAASFPHWPGIQRLVGAGGSPAASLGRHARRRTCSASWPEIFSPSPLPRKNRPANLCALSRTAHGKLWVGGENGLASFDGRDWRFFHRADGLPPSRRPRAGRGPAGQSLDRHRRRRIVHAARRENFRRRTRRSKIFPACWLTAMACLWAGTSGHGLARFAAGPLDRLFRARRLWPATISAI